jgi:hypothetical protein
MVDSDTPSRGDGNYIEDARVKMQVDSEIVALADHDRQSVAEKKPQFKPMGLATMTTGAGSRYIHLIARRIDQSPLDVGFFLHAWHADCVASRVSLARDVSDAPRSALRSLGS